MHLHCKPFRYTTTTNTKQKTTITLYDIAEALQKRNLLRQTKVIQLSSNVKYTSIQFDTSVIMEAFCSNPPLVREQFSITLLPDFRKKTAPIL